MFSCLISHSQVLNTFESINTILKFLNVIRWKWVHLITCLAFFVWWWTKNENNIQVQFPGSSETSVDQKPGQWPIFHRQQSLEDSCPLLLDQLVLAHNQFLSNTDGSSLCERELSQRLVEMHIWIKLRTVRWCKPDSGLSRSWFWLLLLLNIELSYHSTFDDLQTHLLLLTHTFSYSVLYANNFTFFSSIRTVFVFLGIKRLLSSGRTVAAGTSGSSQQWTLLHQHLLKHAGVLTILIRFKAFIESHYLDFFFSCLDNNV